MKMFTVGKSTQGRDIEVAVISSPENLARLDEYKKIARQLATADGLNDEQARKLAHDSKVIVHIDGGLHSSEVAGGLVERHCLAIAQRLPALVVLSLVRARRGDPGVEELLDEAMRLAQPTGELQRIGRVAAACAEVAWYRDDTASAAEHARIGLRAAVGKHDTWMVGELAFWGRRADPTLELPTDIAEPYALMIAGQWEAAAEAWQALGMPYERALALADGSEDALRESLGIIEQLGAGPLGVIVRRRLRERGVRGVPRGPRPSTRVNPAGLTSREVQVLTLLVRGHTNTELAGRLHVSTRTVDHHVSSILEKLDVRSRTEAVAAAFGLGIVKPGA